MKNPKLLIVLLLLIFSCFQAFSQDYLGKLHKPIFHRLTQQDKLNYTLSAGTPITIKRNTFLYKLTPNKYQVKQEKQDYILLPITLTNNSNDTLKYIGMSCSWWQLYETDELQVSILQPDEPCYKNGPTVIEIAPHHSSLINVPVGCISEKNKATNFRIGMMLQKYADNKQIVEFSTVETNNIIWTMEIHLP